MTERFEPIHMNEHEAELTKNSQARTLGGEVNPRMEEGPEQDINREESQFNAAEPQSVREARRAVVEAEEELRRQLEEASGNGENGQGQGGVGNGDGEETPPAIAIEGEGFNEENDREERYLTFMGQFANKQERFEILLQGIDIIPPNDLRRMFVTGAKAHISHLVAVLGNDYVDHEKYEKKFLEAFQADNTDLKVLLRNTIYEIKEELYDVYRKREEERNLQGVGVMSDGTIVERNNPQLRQREQGERSEGGRLATQRLGENLRNSEEEVVGDAPLIQDQGLKELNVQIDRLALGGDEALLAVGEIEMFANTRLGTIYERNQYQQKAKELNNILQLKNINEKTRKLHEFIAQADKQHAKNIIEGKEIVPQEPESIQDLARFIMRKQDSTLYGREGKYPLLRKGKDAETGEDIDIFQPDNFLIWLRDRATKLHYDNATSEISFLNSVGIETYIRTISIYGMTQNRNQYFKDEVTGEILDDLAEQALNEAWGFGITRNMDLNYQKVMNSDSDLPKAIVGLYAGNDLTRSSLLKMFSSMPDRFDNDDQARDTRLGDAFMLAEDIYYNLPDLKELKYVAGEDSPMFKKEWFKKALMMVQKKIELEKLDSTEFYDAASDSFYFKTPEGQRKEVFNENGGINEGNYYNFTNFFLEATPNDTKVAFVRELVRFTIAKEFGIKDGLMTEDEYRLNKEKYDGLKSRKELRDSELKNTLTKEKFIAKLKGEKQANRINLEWVENNSFVTLRPLLIAAKNDTGTRGYDADTKLSVLNYLLRQSGKNTAGPIGNPEALGIFRNLSVDTLAGLKTESGLSPQDIYRFIRNLERGGVRWINVPMNDGTMSRELFDFTRVRGDDGKFLSLNEALSRNPNAEKVEGQELKDLKEEYLGKLKFAQKAMSDYASNQVNRAYEIFHSLSGGEQLNLGKVISYDPWKGIIFEYGAMEELVKDKFLKPMRYAFASNAALNYGSVIRAFSRLDNYKLPIFEDKLLVDHMFGRDVTDDIKRDTALGKFKVDILDDNGHVIEKNGKKMRRELTYAEFVNTSEGRTRLVKNAARARFAAELRMHRKYDRAGERWNPEMIDIMLKAFLTLKEYAEDPDTGEIYETGDAFFTKEDIAWIRKHSGTERYKMVAETYGVATGEGLFKSLGAFKLLFAGIVDF